MEESRKAENFLKKHLTPHSHPTIIMNSSDVLLRDFLFRDSSSLFACVLRGV